LENLCLAEFAKNYKIGKIQEKSSIDDDDNDLFEDSILDEMEAEQLGPSEYESPKKKLKTEPMVLIGSKTQVHKRKRQSILKTPLFSFATNPEEYFYSLLLLYCPFREESELMEGFDDIEDAYAAKYKSKF
jgi:hypothetical protein